MSVPIDPVTLAKLEDFGRRRRRLILVRGVCAALAILLGTMSVIALLDWLLVLPDLTRWVLSLLGYALVVGGVWYTCARLVLRRPSARELARFIEKARPELREDLLSAVELGEGAGGEAWDSLVFRQMLQEDVAGRVKDLPVVDLLSWGRIARWVRAAAAIVIACAALVLVPGLSFDHLLLRSLLPMANLERISRVKVAVLAPDPPDAIVPEGDTVMVRVVTSGPPHGSVLLETFPEGRRGERVEMKALGGRQYESAVSLGHEPLDYRVRAGDAVTRRYRLLARPRPEVARFHKTYRYPAYTRRSETTVTAENGDLEALETTEVELVLETNQEVKSGKIHLEQGGKSLEMRLQPAGPLRLSLRLPILASGLYRVHLVAADTGFENKFSPQYEIRSLPDQLPRVAIEEPQQDLIVPPDEVVTLRGTAKDDIGLDRVVQMIRVNQGEWIEVPLATQNLGTLEPVTRRWDLFDQRVQPGDRLTTKLVATDLKGNRAESAPVHVVITSPGFDPLRLVPLEAKRLAYAALLALREAARAMEKKVHGAVQAVDSGGEIQRTQALLDLANEMEKVSQQADAAEARLKDALRLARAGREAHDLIGAGLLVRRVRDDSVQGARAELQRASSAADKAAAQADMRRAAETFRRAADRAAAAEECIREILASEEAVAALLDLRDLARDEASINRQAEQSVQFKDPKVWERLARRQGVAANQARAVEEILRTLALRARDGLEKRSERIAQDLQNARTQLENALAQPPGEKLMGLSQAMQRQVEAAFAAHHPLELELARRADRFREQLSRRADPNYSDIAGAIREVQVLADLEEKKKQDKDQSARAAERWKASRELLEARAGQEECRRDSDPFFVSDASLASRALGAVLETFQNVGGPARAGRTLKEVEQAFRTLEAGHMLQEVAIALREVGERERWEGPTPNASARHPKDWAWMDDRMKSVPEELKGGRLPAEAVQGLLKAWRGPEGDRVRREMNERLQMGRRPGRVADSLERLGADVHRVTLQIQPAMEEARAVLRKLVPSLPERLAMLAEEARKMEQTTSQLAQKARQEEPAQVRPEARKLLDSQQGLDRNIQDAMTQLRRDANMQDLFTPEGRERARDADDAVAMLTETPPKAEDLLTEAAAAPERQAQSKALDNAAEQQDKMADALKTLAEHYKNVELGKPEETRPELRKAEEALGIKEALDAQYGQMEQLAELARQANREALMQALENALAGNEAMQRKLEQLAQNALDRAEAALQDAEAREERARKDLQQMAQQQAQQQAQKNQSIADQARKIAEQARQMAAKDVPQIAKQAPSAQNQASEAAKDLNEGANAVPQDFSQPNPAAQGMENAAKELRDAAQDLKAAQQAAHQAAQQAQQNAQREGQEAQAAQQKAQQASQQAQQAQQSSQQSAQQAQAAQKAAQSDPSKQQAAQQAAQKAQQSQQAAQEAGKQAQAAQQAAQSEAAQAQAAQQAAQSAQSGENQAGQAAQKAEQLAQQAQQLANQLRQQAPANSQMAQQAAQQGPIAKEVDQAAGDIAQAARHMERLGYGEQAQTFEQVAQSTESVAEKEVPAAQQALQNAQSPAQAQPAVAAAEQAIENQLSSLAQSREAQPSPSPSGQNPKSGLAETAAEFMANALNALDSEMNSQEGQGQQGQQGQPSAQAGQQGSQQAMSAAASAQAQAMRAGRTPGMGKMPGQMPFSQQPGQGAGAAVEAGELPQAQLNPAAALKKGDWGRLPPRLARDLMEAQRENVSGEYRTMIETYFKVVAERAREKK